MIYFCIFFIFFCLGLRPTTPHPSLSLSPGTCLGRNETNRFIFSILCLDTQSLFKGFVFVPRRSARCLTWLDTMQREKDRRQALFFSFFFSSPSSQDFSAPCQHAEDQSDKSFCPFSCEAAVQRSWLAWVLCSNQNSAKAAFHVFLFPSQASRSATTGLFNCALKSYPSPASAHRSFGMRQVCIVCCRARCFSLFFFLRPC